LPNIVATGAVVPAVPLDATQAHMSRMVAPDQQVVAPAPDVQFAPKSVVQAAMKSDVIAPPPELAQSKSPVGLMNIGPSDVVAPAPQLSLPEQHMATRGKGHLPGGGVQPVGPPPSVAAGGGTATGGRLVALGIHPVAPTGPVAAPAGNRRGALSATPQGKPGASGAGRKSGSEAGAGAGDGREMASLSSPGARPGSRAASVVSDDKITDVERKVFRGKRLYEMRLNMPNLNSTTGSWVMKFAELDSGKKEGDLLTPVLTEKSDPGYPLELIRANVHGMVTLYAVINATGKVTDIRVLDSPDDRLDSYAAQALARWKFMPAVKDGKPVALEAVVEIPFKVQRGF
jgi:TonB family protein